MNIILIGFKGCGKTLIGKKLASELKREFYDTDSIIESIYEDETKSCLPFREIYKKHGSEYFRNLEEKALKRAGKFENSVISLGGGSVFLNEDVGRKFKGDVVVYLHVEPDVLYERIMKGGIPVFFDRLNPRESFDKLYNERLPVYNRLADIVIDNSRAVEETVNNILLELNKKNGRK